MKWTDHDKLCARITGYARAYFPDDAFCTLIAHGSRHPAMAEHLKAMGAVPGVPDIMVVWRGRPFFAEVKTGTGTMRTDQRATRDALRRAGAVVTVVHSLGDFCEFIRTLCIPLRAVPRGDPKLPNDEIGL